MTELMQKAVQTAPHEDGAHVRRVCFVCTGNTCRSPMAEAVTNALARQWIENLPAAVRDAAAPTLEAFSAGLYAAEGEPIAQNAVTALPSATKGHAHTIIHTNDQMHPNPSFFSLP